eukprot:scaffold26963_cov47-Phaeocystis_antarctica.AAC.1
MRRDSREVAFEQARAIYRGEVSRVVPDSSTVLHRVIAAARGKIGWLDPSGQRQERCREYQTAHSSAAKLETPSLFAHICISRRKQHRKEVNLIKCSRTRAGPKRPPI